MNVPVILVKMAASVWTGQTNSTANASRAILAPSVKILLECARVHLVFMECRSSALHSSSSY